MRQSRYAMGVPGLSDVCKEQALAEGQDRPIAAVTGNQQQRPAAQAQQARRQAAGRLLSVRSDREAWTVFADQARVAPAIRSGSMGPCERASAVTSSTT